MSRIYSISDIKLLKPSKLRSWFRNGSSTGAGTFAVVDVRESDYVGGHIKGCYHYPAASFETSFGELQDKLVKNEINDVVFHCMLSQARGPKATLRFMRSLNDVDPKQREFFDNLNIWVLQGGFSKWQQEYGEDVDVTEGYDKELWQFGNF